MKYEHFIITRFNIRANYGCKLRNPENNPMNRTLSKYINRKDQFIIEKILFFTL